MIGDVLWEPSEDAFQNTELGRYMRWLRETRDRDFHDYDALWRWSTEDLDGFWSSIWDYFQVRAHAPYDHVLGSRFMPGAQWFPGSRLNYAEHLLGGADDADRSAVIAHSQTRPPVELTFGELREQVARAREGLLRLGVGPGDRVVAYLPNIPETMVAFIATASLGAVWATCAPEFGARGAIDRFAEISPKVLLAVGGYGFRDREIDRRADVEQIRAALPSLEAVVGISYGTHEVRDSVSWQELLARRGPLEFEPVAFDHPLYVLFSSGTTGPPKAIVHGHGGILLEHYKAVGLLWNLKPGDRVLWFTTTAWMMWNSMVSALLVRASVVMIDGDPAWPDLSRLWQLAEQTRPTLMGYSPAMLMQCRKNGLKPGRDHDLSSIEVFATVGSPLPPDGYHYIYEQLGPVVLNNGSGGTDVCTGIVGGSPLRSVYEGEISGPNLGVAATAFDDDGNEIVGAPGELVITQPMPSMPVGFWNDTDGARYRASYFERFPGVWCHGDWVEFTERGSCVMLGRSDATLNRGGVRLGSAEFYNVLEDLAEVEDSLIVHLDGEGAGQLILFVVPVSGTDLDEPLRKLLAQSLRKELSPRHVPDLIVQVPAIPYTRTGKKLETPIKRILQGQPVERAISLDAVRDASAIDAFVAYSGRLQQQA